MPKKFKREYKELIRLISILISRLINRKIRHGFNSFLNSIKDHLDYYFYKKFKPVRTFKFQGKSYFYFHHKYNITWKNERAIEIPIIWEIVKKHSGKRILEIGNVLSHYFDVNYDIIDKYEKNNDIINQDIINFHPSNKYDLIISISTFEHIGWSYKTRDSDKILRVIEKLRSLLSLNGKIIVSFPIGWNPYLDRHVKEKEIQFKRIYYLKKVSEDNQYIETNWETVQDVKLNTPFPGVNGLIIGIIEKLE